VLRAHVLRAAPLLLLLTLVACGSDAPTRPGPIQQPPPQPQPANSAPVIESIAVSSERVETDTDVTVTAAVRDAESPLEQLRFEWAADAGTFSGTGASVRWRLPRGAATPGQHTLRLTVVEPMGATQQSVSANSPSIRVHDSQKELGDLALRFLGDFANSSVAADVAVREFSDSCSGKQSEREDVQNNRRHYQILSSELNLASVRVRVPWSEADMTVRCKFTSRQTACSSSSPSGCRVGSTVTVQGNCNLTAVYEQQRWLLCSSRFASSGLLPVPEDFFGLDR
jgi:hypothetical protein